MPRSAASNAVIGVVFGAGVVAREVVVARDCRAGATLAFGPGASTRSMVASMASGELGSAAAAEGGLGGVGAARLAAEIRASRSPCAGVNAGLPLASSRRVAGAAGSGAA